MNSPILPIICGAALAAMTTAGISHYCTVRQFVAAFDQVLPALPTREAQPQQTPPPGRVSEPVMLADKAAAKPAATPRQEEFYDTLITRLETLQNQNRDIQDQLAETNRDIMKLEFRVDTHSESFRPLPLAEQIQDASFGEEPGVLPPRADPVFLPSYE